EIIRERSTSVEPPWRPDVQAGLAGPLMGPSGDGAPPSGSPAAGDGDASEASRQPYAATVLVVEDQEQVLRVTERALTRSGFTVLATGSSEEALKLLDAGEKVDVLLS